MIDPSGAEGLGIRRRILHDDLYTGGNDVN